MQHPPPQLRPIIAVGGVIADAAALAARSTKQQVRRALAGGHGKALHPGSHTPLWNALVMELRSHLLKRGEKTKLARFLGLPRQRIQDFINSRHSLPDAERTLLLLFWLNARNQGIDPV